MKNRILSKIRNVLITAIPMVFVFLFFVIVQPSHILFQERYQMFLFTTDYLREFFSFPGGLAVYLGRFLMQFFISSTAGALVITLVFWLVQQLSYRLSAEKNEISYVLSFIPSVLITLYICDENAFLSAGISIATGLAAGYPLRFITRRWVQAASALVLAAALYFLAGNLGIVAFAASVWLSCRNIKISICCVATGLICTYLSVFLFDYPFMRLLTGPHYNRYHDTVPLLPWAAAFSLWLIVFLEKIMSKSTGKKVSQVLGFVVLCGLVTGMFLRRDTQKEEMMTYSYLTQCEDWNGILKFAAKKEPVDPISISCLNLALVKTGYLGEWMFRFRQTGRDCLFYPYRREHISPIPSSMIYWNLGFINTSQRFTFAAEEVIPDYQKSAWCHKRLTEIYLVNGDYHLARKQLEPLKYTLFYRSWAKRIEKLLDNTHLIDSDDRYAPIRKLMLKDHRCTYVVSGLREPLYNLCLENRTNSTAYQYLLALDLLDGNLDHFAEVFNASGYDTVPTGYQEAYVLYWSLDHPGPEGMPSFVSTSTINRFMTFSSDINSRDAEYIWKKYADTYWYYYFFRLNQK